MDKRSNKLMVSNIKKIHVAIIGDHIGHSIAERLLSEGPQLKYEHIIIVDPETINTILVNGERYALKEDKKKDLPRAMMNAIMMAEMFSGYDGYGKKYERKLPYGIDLIKEYELVLQKKSKLSKWNRDEVVRQFERIYVKV